MFAHGRVVICSDGDVFGQTRQARSLFASHCGQKKRCLPFVCLPWDHDRDRDVPKIVDSRRAEYLEPARR
jgi:hypothetical protein